MSERIVLTGATGFVGQHAYHQLAAGSREVICTTRNLERSKKSWPARNWVHLDVQDESSVRAVLRRGDRLVYLVHAMGAGPGYAERERASAQAVARIAEEVGVARIVYLGGPEPRGVPSAHLASRLETGRILRRSNVSTIELRAGMIMGAGSESWRITRDLSVRLPVMLLPRWLRNECEPIAIRDVVAAIAFAIDADDDLGGAWDVPGPERLTYQEVLFRVAGLRGTRPFGVPVPLLTPRLSSHWLRFVTRADFEVARELVDGLEFDLVCDGDGIFEHMQGHERMPFDEAARTALDAEELSVSLGTSMLESLVRRFAPASR